MEINGQKLEFNELDKAVNVVLFLVKNKNFSNENIFDMEMCGLKMKDWVKSAVKYAKVNEIEMDEETDILSSLKTLELDDKKYTVVLFSDTPLLKRKTFLDVIDYAVRQNLSVLKLTRGYVFETRYLKDISKLYAPKQQYFDEEDFMRCLNLKQFLLINEILQNRIIDYHIKNGVIFINPSSCNIDVNVVIGENTIIYGNNQIKGKCIIENNSQLMGGNIVENSVLKSGVKIENATIKNSFIEEKCEIMPYVVIENNSLLQSGAKIKSFSYISGSVIKENEIIEEFTKVIN